MTRINVVQPRSLCSQHLVAEYRELPRVFGLVRKAVERGERADDPRNPQKYTLGKGHVRFFYPRLGYLIKRQNELVNEMRRRGYVVGFAPPKREDFPDIPDEWFSDWDPDNEAINVNIARISERMPETPIFGPPE